MIARVFSGTNSTVKSIFKFQVTYCCLLQPENGCQKIHTRKFGQPVAKTHPHILNLGEVTPGISKEEYKQRRRLLMNYAVQKYKDNSNHLIIIPSASRVFMYNDIMYPFRQDTEFMYYSGFLESDSILVLMSKKNQGSLDENKNLPVDVKSVLFVPKRTPEKEDWEVRKSGPEGALEVTGVDHALESTELEKFLEAYCKERTDFVLWCNHNKMEKMKGYQNLIKELLKKSKSQTLYSMSALFDNMVQSLRLVKSAAEINMMKKSVQIASEAMKEVMRFSHPNVNESQLCAKMEYECRMRGAQFLAYIPVIGGGNRANTIHYTNNNQIINDGDLVLMDAGCEYYGYTSDLTRTWPVSVQYTIEELYGLMMDLLGRELQQIGFIPKDRDQLSLRQEVFRFCPHHVSHYLGMDLHDTPRVSKQMKLQPGSVITVEPGLYIREDNMDVPERYRGIGIRIEDDVLITESGPVVMSAMLPKDPDEIEAIMADR